MTGTVPAFEKKATQTIAVVGGVGGQAPTWRNSADQRCRDTNVTEMARHHLDGDGASARVNDGETSRLAALAPTKAGPFPTNLWPSQNAAPGTNRYPRRV